jgi:hypothetical protein
MNEPTKQEKKKSGNFTWILFLKGKNVLHGRTALQAKFLLFVQTFHIYENKWFKIFFEE